VNKYALVLLGLMWVYFFYVRSRSVKILEISQQGEEVEISQGDNKLIAGQSPEFTINLRVFGYNENESHDDIGLLGMITHFFIATPLEANEKIFDQYLCERKSLEQASMIQVIANDAKLRNKVRKLEESDKSQKCAEITQVFRQRRGISGGMANDRPV